MRFVDYSKPRETDIPAWAGPVILFGFALLIICTAVLVQP